MENSSSPSGLKSFRFLRSDLPESYTEAEMQGLAALVSSASGVNAVHEVARHPKGGYFVAIQISASAVERAFVYLAANGYRAAV